MKMKSMIFIVALSFANFSQAAGVKGSIASIKSKSKTSKIVFQLTVSDLKKANCNSTESFSFDTTQAGGENIYRSILHAQAFGLPVKVVTFDSNPCDTEGAERVKAVTIGHTTRDRREFVKSIPMSN